MEENKNKDMNEVEKNEETIEVEATAVEEEVVEAELVEAEEVEAEVVEVDETAPGLDVPSEPAVPEVELPEEPVVPGLEVPEVPEVPAEPLVETPEKEVPAAPAEPVVPEVEVPAEEISMADAMDDYTVSRIATGEVRKGKIIKVTPDEVFVNINHFSDGVVPREELTDDHDADITELYKEGDEISVMVLKADDGEGNVSLSKLKADATQGRDSLKEAFEKGETLNVKVKEVVKGGLRITYMGLEGFMPASLVSDRYVEDLKPFVGQTLEAKVAEYDEADRKIIFSRKAHLLEQNKVNKEKLYQTLKEGDSLEGTVVSIAAYGAFIDLGGVTGLAHISDLSNTRINHPDEVVKLGDKVKVHVLKVDRKRDRISLSLRSGGSRQEDSQWKGTTSVKIGEVVEGTVVKLLDIGAIVAIKDNLEGLVHISEISHDHVADPRDVLQQNQKVMVKVIDIKEAQKRISLSIKDAEGKEEQSYYDEDSSNPTLGDMFKGLLDRFKEEK